MKERIENWEIELWSYINKGDGLHCPMNKFCEIKQNTDFCFDNEITKKSFKDLYKFIDNDDIDSAFLVSEDSVKIPTCMGYARIFELTGQLAKKYRNLYGIDSLPVPDDLIPVSYDSLPIEVRYIPMKVNHGAIWKLNDCWLIQLNSNDSRPRQRFTLYHEIFHVLAHSQGSPAFKKKEDDELYFNEIVADHFAAEVLLPRDMLVSEWPKFRDINKMAEHFNVPKPLMYMGLKVMGVI
jgi:Zn-dependent peptidase ImmA (M78 family)